MKTPILLLLLFSAAPSISFAQTPEPAPKIIKEQNGRITNYYVEGSLASTQKIGCISLAEAKNTFTPPDLYKGARECIDKDDYDSFANLFLLAGAYARFDAERITDRTARQAKSVLIMNIFSNAPTDTQKKLAQTLEHITKTPDLLAQLCDGVRKVGIPNYYPRYMILHGIKAFTGDPYKGGLVEGMDADATWKKAQSEYLHCPV